MSTIHETQHLIYEAQVFQQGKYNAMSEKWEKLKEGGVPERCKKSFTTDQKKTSCPVIGYTALLTMSMKSLQYIATTGFPINKSDLFPWFSSSKISYLNDSF